MTREADIEAAALVRAVLRGEVPQTEVGSRWPHAATDGDVAIVREWLGDWFEARIDGDQQRALAIAGDLQDAADSLQCGRPVRREAFPPRWLVMAEAACLAIGVIVAIVVLIRGLDPWIILEYAAAWALASALALWYHAARMSSD